MKQADTVTAFERFTHVHHLAKSFSENASVNATLCLLGLANGHNTHADLSSLLGTSSASITGIFDLFEKAHLMERDRAGAVDRRRANPVLTKQGHELAQAISEAILGRDQLAEVAARLKEAREVGLAEMAEIG